MTVAEEGTRRLVEYEKRIVATTATQGYNPANANLHWFQRIFFRNSLSLVYSSIPQLPILLGYWGLLALADWISVNPSVRLGAWWLAATVCLEVWTDILKTRLDPEYIYRKPFFWAILAAVWSSALVLRGGDLGMWSVLVWWAGWWSSTFASNAIQLGLAVAHAVFDATLIATVFTVDALIPSGYI